MTVTLQTHSVSVCKVCMPISIFCNHTLVCTAEQASIITAHMGNIRAHQQTITAHFRLVSFGFWSTCCDIFKVVAVLPLILAQYMRSLMKAHYAFVCVCVCVCAHALVCVCMCVLRTRGSQSIIMGGTVSTRRNSKVLL